MHLVLHQGGQFLDIFWFENIDFGFAWWAVIYSVLFKMNITFTVVSFILHWSPSTFHLRFPKNNHFFPNAFFTLSVPFYVFFGVNVIWSSRGSNKKIIGEPCIKNEKFKMIYLSVHVLYKIFGCNRRFSWNFGEQIQLVYAVVIHDSNFN